VFYENDYCENDTDENKGMHVWQKRFYDEIIRDERDFRNKLDYMHYNPVMAGLGERAEDYEFSSYHQYYGKVRNVVQVAIEKIEL